MVNPIPLPLYPLEKDPLFILWETGWAPGPVWTGAESIAVTEIRSPDCPARSELLDRLQYIGFHEHEALVEWHGRKDSEVLGPSTDPPIQDDDYADDNNNDNGHVDTKVW